MEISSEIPREISRAIISVPSCMVLRSCMVALKKSCWRCTFSLDKRVHVAHIAITPAIGRTNRGHRMQFEKEYSYEGGMIFVFGQIHFDGDRSFEIDVEGTVFTNANGDEIEDDEVHLRDAKRLANDDNDLADLCEADFYEDNPRPRWDNDLAEHGTY